MEMAARPPAPHNYIPARVDDYGRDDGERPDVPPGSPVKGDPPAIGLSAWRGRGSGSLADYIYVAPALALVLGLVYYSVGFTIWVSTLNWNGVSPFHQFVGGQNYADLVHDPTFWLAIEHVAEFIGLIFVQMGLGFVFAVILHSRMRLKSLYKAFLFLPVVIAPAVMAPTFDQIFSVNGQVNTALRAVGLGSLQHAWLADPNTAIFVLMAITIWQGTGFSFMLYYASLTQVDPEVVEAARIDGAGSLRIVTRILLPMAGRTTTTLIVLGTIATMKTFDIPEIVTAGGPANSTQFLATYIYQQGITQFKAGYAASLTVVLMTVSLILTVLQLTVTRRTAK